MKEKHDTIKLLQTLCDTHAVSGDTEMMIEKISQHLDSMNVTHWRNNFGVLMCGQKKRPSLVISAHADEVGFQIVRQQDDSTFLVKKCGHVTPVMLNNSHVYVQTETGKVDGFFYPKRELGDNQPESFSEVYLDTLDPKAISAGDFGSYSRVFHHDHEKIIATGLDNKIGVLMLLQLIASHPRLLDDVLFTFVTEEETTYDCIAGVSEEYEPEYAMVIDMFPVHQTSGQKVESLPQVGKGPGILWSMGSYHINPLLRRAIHKHEGDFQKVFADINFAPEPQAMQKNGKTKALNLFIPMLGWHNAAYSMLTRDYEDTRLLAASLATTLLSK